ncbi:hypothetical protein CRU94_07170 [Arcobacter sp. AHV-9/2010]|uniref:hypothetical protein n=1 Tax=Arcobacter sp. AHV-9/2010 TaxID=2021861 RepID=UPI00100C17B1|nr:hypothetical protein [Arcobacter sp. CECT 9299]RXJ95502.1 hypothetical protein CRU94_07170 [Arcobacter sp. CECT 9299]
MYRANFGTNTPPQIQFTSESQYYKALGYLAKSDGTSSIHWEHNENQGAWGSEGRIHFYISNPPIPGYFKLTEGTGNVINRTNCNEFIQNIVTNNMFVMGGTQNVTNIRATIPPKFISDFNYGLTL